MSVTKQAMKITHLAIMDAARPAIEKKKIEFAPPVYPKGVGPGKEAMLAMDNSLAPIYQYANQYGSSYASNFLGYPELSILAQLPEYRMMTETIAKECTRKWIELTYNGTDEKDGADLLKKIEEQLIKHRVRDVFRKALEHDGFYGRGQIYISISGAMDVEPLVLNEKTFTKGSLRGFKNIEPLWLYPYTYNSIDPLAFDYFIPQKWYVMAKAVDHTRLLKIISREVPDILKPAYSFGGLSLSQLAQPYVNNWIRTRNSVGDKVHDFSISTLKTNLATILNNGSGEQLYNRAQLFNELRDNRGLMLIDKDTEELDQINTPLAGLSDLQSQAQECLAGISHIPLVKFWGLSPKGLNASSDGEIRSFYDWIGSFQEDTCRDSLKRVIDVIQLDLNGKIDENVSFNFVQLWQMDDEAQARIRKSNADGDIEYLNAGVVGTLEVRKKIAADPSSGYDGIDVEDLPPAPDPELDDEIADTKQ